MNTIIINNPACYDLEPYIGAHVEYTSPDEPGKVYSGRIEHQDGEAMVRDDADPWACVYTGTMQVVKIFIA